METVIRNVGWELLTIESREDSNVSKNSATLRKHAMVFEFRAPAPNRGMVNALNYMFNWESQLIKHLFS